MNAAVADPTVYPHTLTFDRYQKILASARAELESKRPGPEYAMDIADAFGDDLAQSGPEESQEYFEEIGAVAGKTAGEYLALQLDDLAEELKEHDLPIPSALRNRHRDATRDGERAEQREAKKEEWKRQRIAETSKPRMHKFWVPDRIIEAPLTHSQVHLYVYLCRRAGKSGVAFPRQSLIVKECRMDKKTVSAGVARLEALGLITRQRGCFGRATRYIMVPVSNWPAEWPSGAPSSAQEGAGDAAS
jgi:Helix-turn-helix domain